MDRLYDFLESFVTMKILSGNRNFSIYKLDKDEFEKVISIRHSDGGYEHHFLFIEYFSLENKFKLRIQPWGTLRSRKIIEEIEKEVSSKHFEKKYGESMYDFIFQDEDEIIKFIKERIFLKE